MRGAGRRFAPSRLKVSLHQLGQVFMVQGRFTFQTGE